MNLPQNNFRNALQEGRPQIGLWIGLADAYVAEMLATTGFDWLLIDGEHAPNDVRSILAQLQAVAPYPVHAIVRPVEGDTALIKQILDLGVQTRLVPMVESSEQAARIVAATRYPPQGVRGVGSALARASRWNQIEGYVNKANANLCVLVQVESVAGLANIDAIAAVDGVDGIFLGPADLAASMGLLGHAGDARVQGAIDDAIAAICRAGKAAGVMATDPALARHYLDIGAHFVAVGVDTSLLVRAATQLARQFKDDVNQGTSGGPMRK